ncbi:MAG: hypothetical protein JW880_05220 [Candidatus Thermoplasmatota archaeon]|nr:hypothetical protein [Candidatus Thermoplasmatota archaeon]
MAARTRLNQLAIGIVNLLIVALVFTSIWPFPSGNFKVDLPSASEISWTYQDGIVHIIAPVTIDNRWIYDVDDLSIFYSVTNYSHYSIVEQRMEIGEIPAGRVTETALDFNFDLLGLYNHGAVSMVFSEDLLDFYVEVSCMYTAKLIKFFASYEVAVPWDPLIESYGVSDVRYPSTLPMPGDPVSVDVDYWLHTSDLLHGVPAAQVEIRYYGNETLLGTASTTIALGANHTDTIRIDVTPAYYSNYRVELVIDVAGFELRKEVAVEGWLP